MCLRGASAIEKVLERDRSNRVRVLVVWEPILPTDWIRPGRMVEKRISDPRVTQFWDKHHLVAQEVSRQLESTPERDCCRHNGTLWDVAALYPPAEQWKKAAPEFFEGPVVASADDLAKRLLEK